MANWITDRLPTDADADADGEVEVPRYADDRPGETWPSASVNYQHYSLIVPNQPWHSDSAAARYAANGSGEWREQPAFSVYRMVQELGARVAALEARESTAAVEPGGYTVDDLFVVLSGIHDMDRMNVARHLMRHPRIGPVLRATDPNPFRPKPAPATADTVATDEELVKIWHEQGGDGLVPLKALRATYDLGRQHAETCPYIRSSDEGTNYCALAEQPPAPRQFRVGQKWLMTNGRTAIIQKIKAGLIDGYPIVALCACHDFNMVRLSYTIEGKFLEPASLGDTDYDLMELIEDAPEVNQ